MNNSNESNNGFYVYLPSNVASHGYFRQNTVANYITRLYERISLEGEWEAGLVEVSFPYAYYNVSNNQSIALMIHRKGSPYLVFEKARLLAGHYNSIKDLLNLLNQEIKIKFSKHFKESTTSAESTTKVETRFPEFQLLDQYSRRIRLLNGIRENCLVFVILSLELWYVLGFDIEQVKKMYVTYAKQLLHYGSQESSTGFNGVHTSPPSLLKSFTSNSPYDLNNHMYNVYIYSDIIMGSIVGDSHTKLLRVVHVPGGTQFGDWVHIIFPVVYYNRLVSNEFETIEIDIKNGYNESMPFLFGRSFVVLHFRRLTTNKFVLNFPDNVNTIIDKNNNKKRKS